jgi:hemolysin III
VTSRRADPTAASSVREPVAPAVDDLPQGLADTVADLIGRPRARSWIHLCSAVTATMGGLALVSAAGITSSQKAIFATLIYTVSIVAMFSVSAIYHRKHWHNPAALKWMKRLDHSAIFVFIAGSYTPFALLAMPPRTGAEVLTIVWTGAAAGVALKMWWPSAPRWVGVPLYLLLGWVAICFAGSLLDGGGPIVVGLLVPGRGPLQHRRHPLRPSLAEPVAAYIRLSRVFPRLHRSRGDQSLHRSLVRRPINSPRSVHLHGNTAAHEH